jgi:uncharacterized membrane protein YphA (DoxX/SURF4 family)
MSLIKNIEVWANEHHPKWLDLLRIILGIILFVKGVLFVSDQDIILSMLKGSQIEFISIIIAHYVILAHLVGGITIAVGLLTRLSIAFQIPVLMGAIIFVDLPRAFSSINSDLTLAVLVLCLLLFFFFYGSGSLSVDNYLSKQKD